MLNLLRFSGFGDLWIYNCFVHCDNSKFLFNHLWPQHLKPRHICAITARLKPSPFKTEPFQNCC